MPEHTISFGRASNVICLHVDGSELVKPIKGHPVCIVHEFGNQLATALWLYICRHLSRKATTTFCEWFSFQHVESIPEIDYVYSIHHVTCG